uniref:MarR family transcriptional regulator n=1 Tax=uncultured prokaryote TaxID=198431 RepID=H5SPL7_9ZZZZ|nr:MarR family transcriptional regulator [uncultured prokaryote]
MEAGRAPVDVFSVLTRLARAIDAVDRKELQPLDLTPAQAETLRFIAETRPDMATVTWLARALGVRHATAVGILEPLVERGYVERRPHPFDGRQTVLALTESGRELAQQVADCRSELEVLLARCTPAERQAIEEGLTVLVRAMVESGRLVVSAPCSGCRHFRPNAHGPGRHRCALIDRELSEEESKLKCPEHAVA